MIQNNRITLQIRGQDKDNGDVRFDDFIKQLGALKNALSETDRIISNKISVYFKIVDLRHNSPALVVLEAVALRPQDDKSAIIVNKFFDSINDIERGTVPSGFDYDAFQAFKEIPSLFEKKRLTEIAISRNGDKPKSLNVLSRKVDDILGPDEYEVGSVTGMLEQINLHANQNVFTVYPTSKQPKLRCVFPQNLRNEAIHAVGQYVRIDGQLKFKPRLKGGYPYEMNVREIEIYPQEEKLPKLGDLKGIAPNATGDIVSENFVRGIRDEW